MIKKIIIFIIPFLIIFSSVHYGSPFIIDKLLIVVLIDLLLAAIFYSSLLEDQIYLPGGKFYVPVIIFFVYIIIQTAILGMANQRYLIESLFLSYLILLYFIYLFVSFEKRENSMYLFRLVIHTNSAFLLVYLILAFGHLSKGEHAFSGWLINHNHMAMLTGMLIPYAIAFSVYKHQSLKDRILWLVSLLLLIIGFLFSVSRGAYISLVMAIALSVFVFAWLGVYNKKLAIVLFLTSIAVGAFIVTLYPFENKIFSNLFILSASQRLGIWYGSLRMFLEHPVLGFGIGTYEDAFHRFRPSDILYLVNHAHNVFIEAADETGIVGSGLLLWIISAWLYIIIKNAKRTSSNLKRVILWAGFASTLFLIFHNFIDFGILVPSNAISAIILFAGTSAIIQLNSDDLPPDYILQPSRQSRIVVGIIGTIIFTGVVIFCARAIYGEYLYNKGKSAIKHHDTEYAIKLFTSAQRFINTDKLYFEAGNAWFNLFTGTGDTTALDKAIAEMKHAERLCEWNPYYKEDIGGLYQNKGDLQKAVLYTKRALYYDPTNASLCLRIGTLELETDSIDQAITYFEKACKIYPPYAWDAISQLIIHNVDMKRIEQTAMLLPDGQWVLANELINTPDVSLGYTTPTNEELKQSINVQDMQNNHIVIASDILKQLMQKDPANLQRYVPMFIAITPDKKNALAQLKALNISSGTMLFYIATLESQTNNNASAIKTLLYIIEKDRTYKPAYQLLASIYASQNNLEEAIDLLKTGLYYIPSDYSLYAMLGALYNQENDWYNAVESYKMSVLLNPDYENGYVQMSLIYRAQGMLTQAMDIAKKGLSVLPESRQLKQIVQESEQKVQ
ncbi:MAG: O-antigen ligase family protein [bacterium]